MKLIPLVRRKYFWTVVAGLLFFVVAVNRMGYYQNGSLRLERAQRLVQQKMIDRQGALQAAVDSICVRHFPNADDDRFFRTLSADFDQRECSYYLFQDSVLSYWSTNRVPIPSTFDSVLYSKPLIQLSNGWYLPYFRTKGNVTVLGLALVKYNFLYENAYLENSFANDIPLERDVQLSTTVGSHKIYDSQKRFLFTLYVDEERTNGDLIAIQLIFLFGVALSLLIFAVYSILKRLLSSHAFLSSLILTGLALILAG